MIKLDKKDYKEVEGLMESHNELSVFSVINGTMPGEVYVNNQNNPTSALIQTSECNLIVGSTKDKKFNHSVSSILDFWDQIVPDSIEWINEIPLFHKNKFIRQYKRRRYVLSFDDFNKYNIELPKGYFLKKVEPYNIRNTSLENAEKVLNWIDGFGSDNNFIKYGTGYFIHNSKSIISWSLTDCSVNDKTAIGIQTDKRYRKKGFGIKVVSATINECFERKYQTIDWLCVDTNKGSIAIAEKLGFRYENNYHAFSSYPPIENVTDLTETEWYEWGKYLENASFKEERLMLDSFYCYIKASDVDNAIIMRERMKDKIISTNYESIDNYIEGLQKYGSYMNLLTHL